MQILGTGMSTKMWEVTIEHAKTTCILSDKVHIYYLESPSKTAVVFNAVGEVRGLISEKFVSVDDLTEKEKVFTFLHRISSLDQIHFPFYQLQPRPSGLTAFVLSRLKQMQLLNKHLKTGRMSRPATVKHFWRIRHSSSI